MPVDAAYELGVLVDRGDVRVDGKPLEAHELGYQEPGSTTLRLTTDAGARLLVLGGPPFGERIVMWWNLLGRSHDEIAAFRGDWQDASTRFGAVPGWAGERTAAPPLPGGRLQARGATG